MNTTNTPAVATSRGGPVATRRFARTAATVGALGVVVGDIGTSPLYAVSTAFSTSDIHRVTVTEAHVFGIISLIFWAVTLIVTVKYVFLVLRADNDGEGGILALITLVQRGQASSSRRTTSVLIVLGIFGASLFFGDSVITPAISVLSAVEGLEVVDPSLATLVLPVTAVIIVVLFASQRFGTGAVGRLFGPVMIVWFLAIAIFGALAVVRHPSILAALSPTYAVAFLFGEFPTAFFALGAVVLAITGAEALYADLGNFGRPAITRAWLTMAFPACILSYLGQGALILNDKEAAARSFFLLVPAWGRLPMTVLATAATVIASQAVITGAFSLTHQAIQLGYLPRLRSTHTSAHTFAQIYIPAVNWLLMVSVLTLVFTFRTSSALAYAYGMAVTVTLSITTVLFAYLARSRWHRPLWLIAIGTTVFLGLELLFVAANLTKLTSGAWLPLLIGLVVFSVMTTWARGSDVVTRQREQEEGSLQTFVEELNHRRPPLTRVPGTAVFLSRSTDTAPLAMRANVAYNQVLHEHVVILAVATLPVPFVESDLRVSVTDLGYAGGGVFLARASIGYLDRPDVPNLLRLALDGDDKPPIDSARAIYYLTTIELVAGDGPELAWWRKHLFTATAHLTTDAARYFALPTHRTILIGSRISV